MSAGTNEERLSGGNLSGSVVRVGDTVRRPTGPWTPTVHALLRHLESVGFDGAPRVHGIDEQGREILDYILGEVAWMENHFRLLGANEALHRAGRLLRSFHDAVASFVPPSDAVWRFPDMEADSDAFTDERGKIICHNDATAWNLVIGEKRWAFVDWDVAGPRPFIWDVAYAAIGFVPVNAVGEGLGWSDPIDEAARLVVFADGYGLERRDRERLADVLVARIRSSYDHGSRRAQAGIEPWTTLWREGHGDGWAKSVRHAETHVKEWRQRLVRPP